MKKFLLKWNVGYGESVEVRLAPDQDTAEAEAYEEWKQEVESNADYSAKPFTAEDCMNYGLDEDELDQEQRAIFDKEFAEDE